MPYLAAAVSNILFGLTTVAVRFVVIDTDNLGFAFVRYSIATLLFFPFLFKIRNSKIPWSDWKHLLPLGVLQFGIFPITYTLSLSLTYASRGAIVFANIPLLTYLFAWFLKYDSISFPRLIGTILAFAGVATALSVEVPIENKAELWEGDAWMFLTVLMGASYNVLSRPMMRRYPAMTTTSLYFLSGTIFLGLISIPTGHVEPIFLLSTGGWIALIFSGAVGGALSYYLFNYALEKSSPTQVAIFVPLNPIVATLASALWLGEPITEWFIVGLISVLLGIWLVTNPRFQTPS